MACYRVIITFTVYKRLCQATSGDQSRIYTTLFHETSMTKAIIQDDLSLILAGTMTRITAKPSISGGLCCTRFYRKTTRRWRRCSRRCYQSPGRAVPG
jgi:hypothetical protein